MRNDHSYTINVGGSLWLTSGPTELTAGHSVHSSSEGLVLVSTDRIQGSDALGKFSGVVQKWSLSGHMLQGDDVVTSSAPPQGNSSRLPHGTVVLETRIFVGVDGTTLRFNTTLPLGVTGASVSAGRGVAATADAWGQPSTSFPSLTIVGNGSSDQGKLGGGLGFVSYSEIGFGSTAGVFPTGYKSGENSWDGVPLVLVDPEGGIAAVLSPSVQFYDTVFGLGGPADHAVCASFTANMIDKSRGGGQL